MPVYWRGLLVGLAVLAVAIEAKWPATAFGWGRPRGLAEATVRPRGHRGGIGSHGSGHRARRHRGVDDHALGVRVAQIANGSPMDHRDPF
jgi:hypothetical protein